MRALLPAIVFLVSLGTACDTPHGRTQASGAPARVLRVCADPNNLPFSNERGEGFENRLATLVADSLHARVEYTWWAQRRGFLRNTLNAGACDVVMGLPSSIEMAETTRPYYRSTYVFVTRRDRHLSFSGFDDEGLRHVRIGVQMIGDDFSNSPPAHALSRRGIIQNVVGYSVFGDYREPNPPARIVDAVARGEVDVAVVWGPLAGYFAQRTTVPLAMQPVEPQVDLPFMPFVFDISMAVRRGDAALKADLERVMTERKADIDRLLQEYGVPRVDRVERRADAAGPSGFNASSLRGSRVREVQPRRLPHPDIPPTRALHTEVTPGFMKAAPGRAGGGLS